MMKAWILLYLCVSFHLSVFGQKKDISGTYLSESGTKIEITGNELNYIEPHGFTPVWHNDTLAKCSFTWIDTNFIGLNSQPGNIWETKNKSNSTVRYYNK